MAQQAAGDEQARRQFGEVLRDARGRRSRREAAEVLDCNQATIAKWENGKHLPPENVVRTLDELYGTEPQLRELWLQVSRPLSVLGFPRKVAVAVFDEGFTGEVGVVLRAPAGEVRINVMVVLNWGVEEIWSYERRFARIDERGVALLGGKPMLEATEVTVSTSQPVVIVRVHGYPTGVDQDRVHVVSRGDWHRKVD